MSNRDVLLDSIATTMADYRQQEEVLEVNSAHVDRWIKQFDTSVQLPVLAETDHILKKSYVSKAAADYFMAELVSETQITGGDPKAFWERAGVLNIQQAGASQQELLEVFGQTLNEVVGVGLDQCDSSSGTFIYIDDGVFTGTRLLTDIGAWLRSDAPQASRVHVVAIVLYTGGVHRARTEIEKLAREVGKTVDIKFWCVKGKEFENRKHYLSNADAFVPSILPDDEEVVAYCDELKRAGFPPVLRPGREVGRAALFSSYDARVLIESEFLKTGVAIRKAAPNLSASLRPLGFTGLRTLGFGAATVTYRNCPNNCPLVYWVGSPWYPLFPRKTNTQTAVAKWGMRL